MNFGWRDLLKLLICHSAFELAKYEINVVELYKSNV